MGAHSKPSRVRLPQAPAGAAAAVPTLAGVAAAICLTPQAASAATVAVQPATSTPSTTATSAAAGKAGTAAKAHQAHHNHTARLLAAHGSRHKPAGGTGSYTVRPGDSLSAIAGRVYHDPAAWPVLYWANHDRVKWANLITAGEVLKVPAKPGTIPAAPSRLSPASAYTPKHAPAPVSQPQAAPPRARQPRRRAGRGPIRVVRSAPAWWPGSPAATRR